MSEDQLLEVYRQLRVAQDKYIYFLLAAAASAIALALNRTEHLPLTPTLVPWGVALLLWAMSFYFGCRHLGYVSSTLFANLELLRVQRGTHPEAGRNPQVIRAASEGIASAIEYNSSRASRLAWLQFYFLVAGALAYIVWHLLQMYSRTP